MADKDNDKPKQSTSMHVKVHAPYKIYYDDKAESISAINDTGPFDILPNHHNFMTLLNTCDVIVRDGQREEVIPINRGVMHVKKDKVDVFLDV
jgi:F0F1-type ATP synthase epsilon subunit